MIRHPAIICLLIFFGISASAQVISKKDFYGTEWFANNEDDSFYTSDTVSLVKIKKYNTYQDEINGYLIKLDYNDQKDITFIELSKNGRAQIENLHVKSWSNSKFIHKWRWKYLEDENEFRLTLKRKIHSTFSIESIASDTITSKYGYNGDGTTSVIDLTIITLIRNE